MERGTTTRDEANMTAGKLNVVLVAARDDIGKGTHAVRRRNVVFFRPHDEQRTRDAREPHGPAPEHELTAVELVALIEIAHPPPEELAGERDVLARPRVERL